MSNQGTQYRTRLLIALALYMVALFGINWLDDAYSLPTAVRVGMSLLPILPALMMLYAVIHFVRQMDEVQARIITESMLISSFVVGFACFTYGFVEGAMELPTISLIWVLPALIGVQGIASFFVQMRFK